MEESKIMVGDKDDLLFEDTQTIIEQKQLMKSSSEILLRDS